MMTNFTKLFVCTLLCYCVSVSAAEDVRYYDFEVIIFEALDDEAKISEVWRSNKSTEAPETYVTLGKPYPGPMPKQYIPKYTFKYLPKKTYQLLEEAKLLKESGQYKILLHTSWRQPGMSATEALPIHIRKKFITTTKTETYTPISDPDMPAVNLPQPQARMLQTENVLEGYVKIILSRYLHANFDLSYITGKPLSTTIALTNDEGQMPYNPEPVIYHLSETRKMRSKEVHYIDHPIIGIVILATPFKLDKKS